MSFNINLGKLTKSEKVCLYRELHTKIKVKTKGKEYDTIVNWPLTITKTKTKTCGLIPLGVATKILYDHLPNINLHTQDYNVLLRKEQEIFLDSVLVKNLSKPLAQAWNLRPGFGKTITCIAAIKFYNIDTIIVVHRSQLKKQWEEELEKYNVKNTRVLMISKLVSAEGMLVIDEAHACVTSKGVFAISKTRPRILIGLSGSFYRSDEFSPYLKWFFNDPISLPIEAQKILDDSTTRKIHVRVVKTNFEPTMKMGLSGRLDWGLVLSSLATNEERNKLIHGLVEEYKDKNILILVKIVEHGKRLAEIISRTEPVAICFGSMQLSEQDLEKRILISTSQKIGTGISINKLDCLILATDVVNYYIQYASRILREKSQDALIIDIIDKNFVLQKHFADRCIVYNELGAKIC